MNRPVRHEVDFPADHGQYWVIGTLEDDEEVPQPKESKRDSGTLEISRKGRAGHIGTLTPYGDVHLVFEFHQQAPAMDTSDWREVVEGSMRFAGEVFLHNPADDQEIVPAPGGATELSWWRVRVHIRTQSAAPGLHPPGVKEMRETHLIQLWPALKSPYEVILPDRSGADESTEADECVAGSAAIAFREPSHTLTLYVGDGAPQIPATGELLVISPDGRGARIATQGWGDKFLFGTVVSFTRALPAEAREWEIEAEFTLSGPGGDLRVVPDEDEEYADTVPLPGPDAGDRWHVIVYVRGRDPRREEGEYYVTVWPEP
jgi:hypothetical protein